MKKIKLVKIFAVVMAVTMMLPTFAFADDKPFVALGQDLKAEETNTILSLFGVGDITDCNVIYITNADEHKYLGEYVPAAQIGNQALSSVMIEENSGTDIDVKIHNINYCTEGMYKNALATAGVTGAKVVVAGPYPISGTAALVGTIKAYEEMTGEEVSDEVIEGCVEEITTTGDIGEEVGDKGAVENIVAELKGQIAENPDMSDTDIIEAIKAAADKFGISLSESQIEQLKDLIKDLKGLDIDWDNVKKQSLDIFNKVKDSGLLDRIIDWFKSLFN